MDSGFECEVRRPQELDPGVREALAAQVAAVIMAPQADHLALGLHSAHHIGGLGAEHRLEGEN